MVGNGIIVHTASSDLPSLPWNAEVAKYKHIEQRTILTCSISIMPNSPGELKKCVSFFKIRWRNSSNCDRQFTDHNTTSVTHDTVALMAMWCLKLTTLFISWAEFGAWLFFWPVFCYSESTKNVNKTSGSHWSTGEERKQEKDRGRVERRQTDKGKMVEIQQKVIWGVVKVEMTNTSAYYAESVKSYK